MTPLKLSVMLGLWILWFATPSWAEDESPDIKRFFYSGDGRITVISERTGQTFSGVYRNGLGRYEKQALCRIAEVFEAPCNGPRMKISLRLIEFMDYLEDHFKSGSKITIVSGFRKPEYNTLLQEKGMLAAKASLHQYGMAADIKIEGVDAKTLWNYIKALEFGGAGYYHGDVVHTDVGPARFWDETTSGVGTGISDNNKRIGIVTDYDIYQPGMTVTLSFIQMTAFPIHVSSLFALIRQNEKGEETICRQFTPTPASHICHEKDCMIFHTIEEMNSLTYTLPKDLPPGRYKIQVDFCGNTWPDMPSRIDIPVFVCQ